MANQKLVAIFKNKSAASITLSVLVSFLFVFAFATSTTTISSTGITATGSGSFETLTVTATSTMATTTIDGYLGIGTTSPYAKLSVVGQVVAEYFNATTTTGYKQNDVVILTTGTSSLNSIFIGEGAGYANTTGTNNLFAGYQAGYSNTDGGGGVFLGNKAGYSTNDNYNRGSVMIGNLAGAMSTGGDASLFIGNRVGYRNTGNFNFFMGAEAGPYNANGQRNTFLGHWSGELNVTGSENTYLGYVAGEFNAVGSYNTAIGTRALKGTGQSLYQDVVISDSDSDLLVEINYVEHGFVGGEGFTLKDTAYETITGYNGVSCVVDTIIDADNFDTTCAYSADATVDLYRNDLDEGMRNTAVGYYAGESNEYGRDNTYLGYYAGRSNTRGGYNVYIGKESGVSSLGSDNVFIGGQVATSSIGSGLTFIGKQAGYKTVYGQGDTGIGYQSLYNLNPNSPETGGIDSLSSCGTINCTTVNTTFTGALVAGDKVNIIGTTNYDGVWTISNVVADTSFDIAKSFISTGTLTGDWYSLANTNNTALGYQAGYSNNTGADNFFGGYQAGYSNTTGASSTFIGFQAGYSNSTGIDNFFGGSRAGYSYTTGNYNVVLGTGAGYSDTTGIGNVVIGKDAGYYYDDAGDGSGENTIIGYKAGYGAAGSSLVWNANTFLGAYTGNANQGGTNNTFVGDRAGILNTNGGSNIFLGVNAGNNMLTGSNNILIGIAVNGTSTDSTNFLNIGNTIYGDLSTTYVGIGTTSPYAKLSVVGETVSTYFTATSTTATSTFSGGLSAASSFYVLQNGKVGIGDTAPANLLEIMSSGAANTQLTISNTNAGDYNPQIGFELADGTSLFTMGVDDSDSDKFKIYSGADLTGSSEFTIDSTGLVSIANLEMGAQVFADDAGVVSWVDLPVASAVVDTAESYSAQIDGNDLLTIYAKSDGSGGIKNQGIGIATTTPRALLTVGSSTPAYLTTAQQYNSAYVSGQLEVGGTGTSTFAGYIDVKGAATATSTITGNLDVQGSLEAAVSYTGDLIFANSFRFYEDPMPIDDQLSTDLQTLKLTNHKNEDIFSIDENGNIKTPTFYSTSTIPSQSSLLTDIFTILGNQLETARLTIWEGVVAAKEFIAEKVTGKQICVEDVCFDRSEFDTLKAVVNERMSGQAAPQTPAFEPPPPPPAEEVVTPPAEEPAVETPPAEITPVEAPPVEAPPVEVTPVETAPVETPATEPAI